MTDKHLIAIEEEIKHIKSLAKVMERILQKLEKKLKWGKKMRITRSKILVEIEDVENSIFAIQEILRVTKQDRKREKELLKTMSKFIGIHKKYYMK